MTEGKHIAAGTLGAILTFVTPERIAYVIGLLTLALLVRRCFFTFRGDLRRWRASRARASVIVEKRVENAPDRPE